tara:strand:- start:670 stop:843 length:174 start_codon:yes stop_codon:yes gene_type:complete
MLKKQALYMSCSYVNLYDSEFTDSLFIVKIASIEPGMLIFVRIGISKNKNNKEEALG